MPRIFNYQLAQVALDYTILRLGPTFKCDTRASTFDVQPCLNFLPLVCPGVGANVLAVLA